MKQIKNSSNFLNGKKIVKVEFLSVPEKFVNGEKVLKTDFTSINGYALYFEDGTAIWCEA